MRKVVAALVAVLVLGTTGYMAIEKMPLPAAFSSTVSVMATVGMPQNISSSGQLFTTALIIAAIGVWVAFFVKFFTPGVKEQEDTLTGFFGPEAGNENLMMKEVKVGSGSALAGLKKSQILERYGTVVVGIKRKSGFDINLPLTARVKSGSTVLLLGSPATIMGAERKRKTR